MTLPKDVPLALPMLHRGPPPDLSRLQVHVYQLALLRAGRCTVDRDAPDRCAFIVLWLPDHPPPGAACPSHGQPYAPTGMLLVAHKRRLGDSAASREAGAWIIVGRGMPYTPGISMEIVERLEALAPKLHAASV